MLIPFLGCFIVFVIVMVLAVAVAVDIAAVICDVHLLFDVAICYLLLLFAIC